MISEQERHRLYTRLGAVLGTEEAGTMIELLPAGSWDDLATNQRLDQVSAEIRGDLRAEMANLRTELKTEMADLRTELKTEMAGFQATMNTEMANFQGAIRGEMAGFRTDITTEMTNFQAAMRIELAGIRAEIHRSARQAMAVNTAAMIAIGGMLVAALRI